MRIKRLIQQIADIEVKGSRETEINGLCSNSKLVAPGNLFIAKKGTKVDGAKFIPEAIAAGAVAILTDFYDPYLGVVQLIHPDVSQIEAKLAAAYYQHPSSSLKMVGITGTNGKTTSSYLIKHLYDQLGMMTGVIGTIEWVIGQCHFPATMTTPDVLTNHKLLREMVSAGCKAAVMEVTSHALSQNRVGEIDFDIALFTNLTQDHLDYHGDMESYRLAKEKLFSGLSKEKWAIFNSDDPTAFQTVANVLTYGIEKPADLMAKDLRLSDKGIEFTACFKGEEAQCKSPLIGKFNVYNLLGAIGVGLCADQSLQQCVEALKSFKGVPGRLERVKNRLGLNILVDFAHTDDALKRVLETLQPLKKGKIITVFGCGGDRDKQKREKMGRVVCQLSDRAIVTSDNPRSEDPEAIIQQVLKGFNPDYAVETEVDRQKAIQKAIGQMGKEDILLIAGKGHEKQQIFAHKVIPFDDVEVARQCC
ncbi:MAG: UDP-N-acetylmuramoyl-L-alanyl-D-glutamate--2,6-diaminopimelate ligase [Verrucomicrobia bacterium]|nr:UDP-N-acetylmuramoyl-L-alanyl-D-glutamate--2,6-diaminopimelate ligase [Verrucomicrobiota bacterium]